MNYCSVANQAKVCKVLEAFPFFFFYSYLRIYQLLGPHISHLKNWFLLHN